MLVFIVTINLMIIVSLTKIDAAKGFHEKEDFGGFFFFSGVFRIESLFANEGLFKGVLVRGLLGILFGLVVGIPLYLLFL